MPSFDSGSVDGDPALVAEPHVDARPVEVARGQRGVRIPARCRRPRARSSRLLGDHEVGERRRHVVDHRGPHRTRRVMIRTWTRDTVRSTRPARASGAIGGGPASSTGPRALGRRDRRRGAVVVRPRMRRRPAPAVPGPARGRARRRARDGAPGTGGRARRRGRSRPTSRRCRSGAAPSAAAGPARATSTSAPSACRSASPTSTTRSRSGRPRICCCTRATESGGLCRRRLPRPVVRGLGPRPRCATCSWARASRSRRARSTPTTRSGSRCTSTPRPHAARHGRARACGSSCAA